jgi:hypothetical protein
MKLTEDELKLLRAIEGSNKLGLPCSPETIDAAKPLVDRGLVTITETGNAVIPDETKWKLLGAGVPL